MTKSSEVQAVENYIAALNEHDMEAIDALYADNATLEDPVGSEPKQGKEAILEFYKVGFDAKISARLTGPVRLAGGNAVFPFVVELNPGNGEMRIDIIDQFTFDSDGKVLSMKAFWGAENITTP